MAASVNRHTRNLALLAMVGFVAVCSMNRGEARAVGTEQLGTDNCYWIWNGQKWEPTYSCLSVPEPGVLELWRGDGRLLRVDTRKPNWIEFWHDMENLHYIYRKSNPSEIYGNWNGKWLPIPQFNALVAQSRAQAQQANTYQNPPCLRGLTRQTVRANYPMDANCMTDAERHKTNTDLSMKIVMDMGVTHARTQQADRQRQEKAECEAWVARGEADRSGQNTPDARNVHGIKTSHPCPP